MSDDVFVTEREADVLIVTPTQDLGETEFDRVSGAAESLLVLFSKTEAKHVILDLSRTTYYGSSVLGLFIRLWKRVKTAGGEMVLCGLSPHEQEILQVTRLDAVWPQVPDRQAALREIRAGTVRAAESS